MTWWRNGSAFDSRSKGWGFDSLSRQKELKPAFTFLSLSSGNLNLSIFCLIFFFFWLGFWCERDSETRRRFFGRRALDTPTTPVFGFVYMSVNDPFPKIVWYSLFESKSDKEPRMEPRVELTFRIHFVTCEPNPVPI